MRATTTHTLLCALALAALAACEDNQVSLQIIQMNRVQTDECRIEVDLEQRLSLGRVDVALADSYSVHPIVINKLLETTQVKQHTVIDSRIDTHDILLKSAVIEYTALDQITAPLQETVVVPISVTVPLNTTLAMGVEVLSNAQLQLIRQAPEFLIIDSQSNVRPVRTSARLIVRIRLRGETLDGKEIESNEFTFPIEVCNGCLITYPPEAIDLAAGQVPNCRNLSEDDTTTTGLDSIDAGCFFVLGTDFNQVDCRDCQGFAVDSIARQLCQPPLTP